MRTQTRPKGVPTIRRRRLPALLLGSVCALLLASPAVAAAQAPEVGYLAASGVSTSGATIEVPIDPEGAETSYEIRLECQSPNQDKQHCETLTVDPQRREGSLPPGSASEIVTDAVSGLQPGYLYEYGVIATNSTGREGFIGDAFITCPSHGSCPSQPYLQGESLWVYEGARRAGEEAPRLEAERDARKREAEERAAREEAARGCVVPR